MCLLIQSGGSFVQCVSAEGRVLRWAEVDARLHWGEEPLEVYHQAQLFCCEESLIKEQHWVGPFFFKRGSRVKWFPCQKVKVILLCYFEMFLICGMEEASGSCVWCKWSLTLWLYFLRGLICDSCFQCCDVSVFCSGTLKRTLPSGLKRKRSSFYSKVGQSPPTSAPTLWLCSGLCLAGKKVKPSLLQVHQI